MVIKNDAKEYKESAIKKNFESQSFEIQIFS